MIAKEGASTSNVLRNIGYYYAFCECIECRLAVLLSDRDYQSFHRYVYEYAMCGFSEHLAAKANDLERKMWGFTVGIHDKYAQALLSRGIVSRQISFATNTQIAQGSDERITTKQRYEILSRHDRQKCAFASMLQQDKGNSLKFKENIIRELKGMLAHLNRSFNLYLNVTDNMVKYIETRPRTLKKFNLALRRRDYIFDALFNQKSHLKKMIEYAEKTSSYIQPYPTNVVASMWVFVSHLGRAAVYQCCEDFAKAENELIKSKDHLDRAIMDSNKNLIMFLSGSITKHIFRGHTPANYWNDMIKARKMEHDREDFLSRVEQFNLLLRPVQVFTEWLAAQITP